MKKTTVATVLEHLCNEARNSAHATLGAIDLIQDLPMDESRREALRAGVSGASRLLRSIDDLREVCSPKLGYGRGVVEEFDLRLLLCRVVDGLNLASGGPDRRIVLEGSTDAVPFQHVRGLVERLFTRLLDTVTKMSPVNEVRVSLHSKPVGNRACLHIAAGDDAALTARFFGWLQDDVDELEITAASDALLAVSVMVAGQRLRALDASVELAPDGGATGPAIVIELPARLLAKTEPASDDADARSTWAMADNSLRILIVEDSDESFVLTELIFDGEKVTRARDGQDALRLVANQRFDAVFMDVHMPGMDGYSTIHKIREWETETGNARTPIVVLSSDEIETQRHHAAGSGCSGFLRKPLCRSDLGNLLQFLRQSRMPTIGTPVVRT